MVYTLPGRNYTEADLNRIHEQALRDADAALLEDAWEVSNSLATCACLEMPQQAQNNTELAKCSVCTPVARRTHAA